MTQSPSSSNTSTQETYMNWNSTITQRNERITGRNFGTQKDNLKQLVFILLLSTQFASVAYGQGQLPLLLSQAQTLQAKGDYLFAAQLFKFISARATDSTMIADALYGYVSCGDRAADALTVRSYTYSAFHQTKDDPFWKDVLNPIIQHDIAEFAKVGINLEFIQFFESYCVNADPSTRQLLSKHFSNTPSGELAAFDLITEEVTSSGFPAVNGPYDVIRRALAFLHRYPDSHRKFDVYHILGRAFQDLWGFSQDRHYNHLLSEADRANPERLRQEAMRYYRLAKDNRQFLKKYGWGVDDDDVLSKLENKEDTSGYYFFGD